MIKVTDTLKRVIKFEDVEIVENKLYDGEDVVKQIIENLPSGVETFNVQITAAIPSDDE